MKLLGLLLSLAMFTDVLEGAVLRRRIVGGSAADISAYPWQLALTSGNTLCGAALVGSTRGVTAAHCAAHPLSTYAVLAGTSDRTVRNCATCVSQPLTRLTRNPSFSVDPSLGFPNDIAVLRFNAIATNVNIRYVSMATADAPNYAGQTCVITGWGQTSASSPLSPLLQQAAVIVLTNDACSAAWAPAGGVINAGHVCEQSPTAGACSGDSGGPLVCGGTLVGVTSWGPSDCNPSMPSVYTRISTQRAWIDTQ